MYIFIRKPVLQAGHVGFERREDLGREGLMKEAIMLH